MKKCLLLLLAAFALVACEDTFNVDEVMNEYSFEQLNALTEGFKASDIDYDQLVEDLTNYSIFVRYPIGIWYHNELCHPDDLFVDAGGCYWCGKLFPLNQSVQYVFNADGSGAQCVRDLHDYELHKNPLEPTSAVPFVWEIDKENGLIVCTPTVPVIDNRGDKNEEFQGEYKLQLRIAYYKSPLLIFDTMIYDRALAELGDELGELIGFRRYKMNISEQVTNEELWSVAKTIMADKIYLNPFIIPCQYYKGE